MLSWAPEYAAAADVELVVGGAVLPAHRQVLSISPVFCVALERDGDQKILFTEEGNHEESADPRGKDNDLVKSVDRTRIESAFQGVNKEDMCLLLDHVYPTDAFFRDDSIDDIRRVIVMADRFSFEPIVRKCLNLLMESSGIRSSLVSGWRSFDAKTVGDWVWVAQRFSCENLKAITARGLADRFNSTLGRNAASEWNSTRQSINADMWRRTAQVLYHDIYGGR